MKRLHTNEYLHHAPEDAGMVRVNHESLECTGSSKSMRVTRADDGTVYAKCYRCGGFGRWAEGAAKYSSYSKAVKSKEEKGGKVNNLSLPYDINCKYNDFPAIVKSKLHTYHIPVAEVKKYGIGWSEKLKRMVLPIYHDGELRGWQGRSYDQPPKYITKYKDESDLYVYIPCTEKESKDCIIVEDMLSCIRVSKYGNALALLGSNISDKALIKIAKLNNNMLVYLDHDTRQVIMNTIQIRERLTMLGKSAKVISSSCDPKELDNPSLSSLILSNL